MTQTIRVLVADDHAVVRRALRLLLDAQADVDVVGESADVKGVVDMSLHLEPAVVVCDLTMPGGNTLAAISEIAASGPAVVVLTMQSDPSFAAAALRAGAVGYLLKESAPEELVTAVRAAAAGEGYVDPRVSGRLMTRDPGVRRREP
ncbi:MAG TPA: response regulator transcription factor [Solirubrobacteraceae bacterium]